MKCVKAIANKNPPLNASKSLMIWARFVCRKYVTKNPPRTTDKIKLEITINPSINSFEQLK